MEKEGEERFLTPTTSFEEKGNAGECNSKVVVVTGPCCGQESMHGAVTIEPVVCNTVEFQEASVRPPEPASPWLSESFFGAKDEIMQEMEERKRGSEKVTHIVPSGEREVAGFDACREYEYKYADDEDDGSDQDEAAPSQQVDHSATLLSLDVSTLSFANPLEASTSSDDLSFRQYVLGKTYHPLHDYTEKRQDESSLLWFTYRIDFPEIKPYAITTDAGWGCMLRSAQMLLGQTMRMHYKNRNWRPPASIAQKRRDLFLRRMLTWFADFPSKNECFFSLHNMVAAGFAKHDVLPGEWYGPGTACYVLRDLCQMLQERESKMQSKPDRRMFRVYVASQGTVYKDEVNDLMTKEAQKKHDSDKKAAGVPKVSPVTLTHPLDPQYDVVNEIDALDWDTSLLLMVPLRLGLKNFNEKYSRALAHMFGMKQSVGVLGGRPRGARWFYGATSDGQKLYGLDPHTVQAAPMRREVKTSSGATKRTISFTESYLRSVQTTNPETMDLKRVDPSLAVGFYCNSRDEFEDLCASLHEWNHANKNGPELFAVADRVPDYSANVSSAMNEMLSMSEVGDSDTPTRRSGDEDDDFVLL